MADVGTVTSLLERQVYTFAQVDELLGLRSSTAQRWINGYTRRGVDYAPVIRVQPSNEFVATWGEFVECRFLAEYRSAGVPMINMRPVVEILRQELDTAYPLASAALWLEPRGKEIVARVQDRLGARLPASFYVVRTNDVELPLEWEAPAVRFIDSLRWSTAPDTIPVAIWPDRGRHEIEIDPLRAFGEPTIRGVQTAVLAELVRAGDTTEMVADLYDLRVSEVEAAVAFEQGRAQHGRAA